MVQFRPIMLKSAFNGCPPRGHAAVRCRDELHVLRHKGEQVVPPAVQDLLPAVRHVTVVNLVRRDLARVHGILHDGGADEHGRLAVGVRAGGLARPLDAGERGPGEGQGDAVPRGRHLRHRHDRRGRVTRGRRLVVATGLRIPRSAAATTSSPLGQV